MTQPPSSARVRPTTFLGGAGIALLLAAAGAALFASLTPLLSPTSAIRTIATLLSGAYLLYLLSRSGERAGRVVTVAAWIVCAVASITWVASLPLFFIGHVAMIWLIRTLYFHSSFVTALLDLGVGCLALAAAIWAARSSNSVFLAVWCFFLVQALFVALPADVHVTAQPEGLDDQPFKRAHRSASAALRRLANSTHHIRG